MDKSSVWAVALTSRLAPFALAGVADRESNITVTRLLAVNQERERPKMLFAFRPGVFMMLRLNSALVMNDNLMLLVEMSCLLL